MTVQIPYELQVVHGAGAPVPGAITVSDNGVTSKLFNVTATFDLIHLVKTCDIDPSTVLAKCDAVVLRADGSLVSQAAPASAGEVVTIQAWGF